MARGSFIRLRSIVIAAAMFAAGDVGAAPLMHQLFQDHVVLQRNAAINVWGQAQPDDTITVSLADSSAQAKADSTGRWQATLPSKQAGGLYELVAKAGSGVTQ